MALPTKTSTTGTTPTTVVYQPLGGSAGRVVLAIVAALVLLLAGAAIQALATSTSNTRRELVAQPPAAVTDAITHPVPTEPVQPLGAPPDRSTSRECGLACTEEIAALWRAHAEPGADHAAIDRSFHAAVRTALNAIEQAAVDSASALR